ncbi:MAG TPA: non-ribosomal peptide synthetase, partial [Thermoanaerobaculia bacterium]|nr:non-ribosomal peptide synthetase [Thermoanaerobaculia bacterium]
RTARRRAAHPAIAWEDQHVTYRQLEERANEIAATLLGQGLAPGSLVAILGAMTADVVASMLGVLKAGCAFVPFDAQFPAARLESAVAEVSPRCWLADEKVSAELALRLAAAGMAATVVPLAGAWLQGRPAAHPVPEPPGIARDPDGLCYVYFTSGSTGRPKAIAGRFKAIDHFVQWHLETFGVSEDSRICQLTSFAFDGFLHEAFAALAAGGTLVVASEREMILDGARLVEWIEREAVTLMHCTPSLFRSILSQDLEPTRLPALRHVLLAGEPVLPADVRRWCKVFGERIQLVNLYGPTETTLTKFSYFIRPEDAGERAISIGKPMPGALAVVVDEKGKVCPPGKLGEIYIRTPYRTLGYLNAPELTADRFVQNPFSDLAGDVVYKTGDLGRLRENGDFEFVGRRDQQVKVRGVRVEIGAIEDLLRGHPAVVDAAVEDRLDIHGNKFLCAYVVLTEKISTELLSELLLEHLPPSAVPSAFVAVEQLPRTLSGNVDRRALPDPAAGGGRLTREYVAPQTPVEEKLCEIYMQLLRVPRVGIQDHFFELGGHSLLVMQLLARVRSAFVAVPLGQVFETPTVEGLAIAVTERLLLQAEQQQAADLLAQIEALPEDALDRQLQEAGGR